MGIFICFILPGIIAGLLLGNGSRAVSKHAYRKDKQNAKKRVSAPVKSNAHFAKGGLYIYDLKQDINNEVA